MKTGINQQKKKLKNMKLDRFKIRCSAISSISAKATAGRLISVGAQTYCKKWLKEKLFDRDDFVSTKYTEKGIQSEEESMNIIVEALKLGMVYKNEERKEDNYKTGEIDFIYEGVVYDNKSSFSLQTFPLFDSELDKIYVEQMKGYLDLWGADKGKVCYTLVNTPSEILASEIRWLKTDDEKQKVALNHIFDKDYFEKMKNIYFQNAKDIEFKEIPLNNRIKVFEVDRDDAFIKHINNTVENCNIYIKDLINNI